MAVEHFLGNIKGPKGDVGEKGHDGQPGAAATIEIGAVTTGEQGTQVEVTNSGDSNAAVFNFTIPKGEKGDKGDDGQSSTVEIGTVVAGENSESAEVTNSGTPSAAVLDFVLPKGDKGDKGDRGTDGVSATIQIGTVTTVDHIGLAEVTNSGDETSAVLNFAIPRGEKGDQGEKGEKGDDGEVGQSATVQIGTVIIAEGDEEASITNSGNDTNVVLNFVIPRGNKGDQGERGEKGEKGDNGDSATIEIGSVSLAAYGEQAMVSNSGTLTSAVLNFKLPQGEKGEKGDVGETGEKGDKGDTSENVIYSPTEPEGATGYLWLRTTDGVMHWWNGSEWSSVTSVWG